MKRNISIILMIVLLTYICYSTTEYKIIKKQSGSSFVRFQLQYTGTNDYYIKQKSKIIKILQFTFTALTYQDFNIKILDPTNKRYQVPQDGIFPKDPHLNYTFPLNLASYAFSYFEYPFTFKVIRKNDNSILFDSSQVDIIFSQYYIQIGTILDSQYAYGLSQRFTNSFRLQTGKWTIFNRDRGQMMDYGIGKQTHGYYPIYLLREKSEKYHINYLRTSNALDVIIDNYTTNQYLLTYKVIGGIIDLRFFTSQFNPQTLINKFHTYLGKSIIPPFWSLGFHQCRWGYKNVSKLEQVLQNYEKNGIPLDTIWTDIDYMKDYQTFTIDQDRFQLNRMRIITQKYHYIPIIEPSIRNNVGYAYQEGKKRNIFIKDAQGNDQIGKVWAGEVLFTDYFHPNSTQYWRNMLEYLYKKIPFSGVWLDMNQISNLCNGPCTIPSKTGIDYTNDIPYHPGYDKIQTQAIPLNATHYGDLLQANVHAYFGFMQTYATYKFLYEKGRPFIITRSSTLGSNRYGFHWTGDNYANFQFLKTSISGNFMFNFWGMQMVGSDICGFGGNATQQICARWFQLGSLYPFARDHNDISAIDQQPYALGPKVLESSKKNLKLRYSILKAYYREFINKKGQGTIFKPLFFEFFKEIQCFQDDIADTQFMIGNSLMSAPILIQNTIKRQVYFPGANWYDLHSGKFYPQNSLLEIENTITDLVPLFLRQGHIILRQDTKTILQTKQLTNQFYLIGAMIYNKDKSIDNKQYYNSVGGTLSIEDYNNNQLIKQCQQNGCDYQIKLTFFIDKDTGYYKLTLDVLHIGNSITLQLIKINKFILYTKDNIYTIQSTISIKNSGIYIVPIHHEDIQ